VAAAIQTTARHRHHLVIRKTSEVDIVFDVAWSVFSDQATKLGDILLLLNTGKHEAASATDKQLVKTTPR